MKLKMIILAAVLAFSGCLNLPYTGSGDTVIADVTVYDADTGAVLTETQAYQFVLGEDRVGFGLDFEEKLEGLQVDDTRTFFEKGPTFDETVMFPAVFGPFALANNISRVQFEVQIGVVGVGEMFHPPGSAFSYQVDSMDDQNLTYRALPQDGQSRFIPELGADLVIHLTAGDTMTQYFSPVVGSMFTVEADAEGTTIMNLAPGSYQTQGGDLGLLEYGYSPAKPEVIGKNLRLDVKVLLVIPGETGTEFVEGNYGVRSSPVLNGPFNPNLASQSGHEGHDDGHDHTH